MRFLKKVGERNSISLKITLKLKYLPLIIRLFRIYKWEGNLQLEAHTHQTKKSYNLHKTS